MSFFYDTQEVLLSSRYILINFQYEMKKKNYTSGIQSRFDIKNVQSCLIENFNISIINK